MASPASAMGCAGASRLALPALPVMLVTDTVPTMPLTEITSEGRPSILSHAAPSKMMVSPAFHCEMPSIEVAPLVLAL